MISRKLALYTLCLLVTSALAAQPVRVGVWDNPPLVTLNGPDGAGGFAVEVLREVAQREGWELQYVPGSWAEQLEHLERGEIDILVCIAFTPERAERFAFSRQSLLGNWAVTYTRPGENIHSILDLSGRRVALAREVIHTKAFAELAERFEIRYRPVYVPSFPAVLEAVARGEADAGVVNRLLGAQNADRLGLVQTGIIFNPINIHYAAPRDADPALLDALDRRLAELKATPGSIYHQALARALGSSPGSQFPAWLGWAAGLLAAAMLLSAGIALLLRREVARRTQELATEVAERRAAQARLDRLAHFDPLTGLPNRISFADCMNRALTNARDTDRKVAVMFADLDRLKTVNDSLGHVIGDALISQVAQRLAGCLRGGDTVHRFGGDEFVIVLPDLPDATAAEPVARRLLAALERPVPVAEGELCVSASIGIAFYPDDGEDADTLLKHADAAMYQAKALGGNRHAFFSAALSRKARARLSMETRLRHALERGELALHYQPIFRLDERSAVGVEALLRWQHPEQGPVPPDRFIPVAEETGLIVPIGEWVLAEACRQVQAWRKAGAAPLRLAVNVSSRQFLHHRLADQVTAALRDSGLEAGALELEITEGIFLELTPEVRDTLERLRAAGVSLSIDDFGTGYSSLSYLKQLPVDTLKIDRSFVSNLPADSNDAQIAATIIAMAHGLGLKVVAEGIETEDQRAFLLGRGCDLGQGYLIARPAPPEAIGAWLLPGRADVSAS